MLRQRTIKVEDTFHHFDLQRIHIEERTNYLSCKRHLLDAGLLNFYPLALWNFDHFYPNPIFSQLVCCEECDPVELYLVLTKVWIEKSPYPMESTKSDPRWLEKMLRSSQTSAQGLSSYHYHGQIFRLQFGGL